MHEGLGGGELEHSAKIKAKVNFTVSMMFNLLIYDIIMMYIILRVLHLYGIHHLSARVLQPVNCTCITKNFLANILMMDTSLVGMLRCIVMSTIPGRRS